MIDTMRGLVLLITMKYLLFFTDICCMLGFKVVCCSELILNNYKTTPFINISVKLIIV